MTLAHLIAGTRERVTRARTALPLLVVPVVVAPLLMTGAAAADADTGPPPRGKLEMTGDVGDFVPDVIDDPVHDPTLFEDDGTYYVFSTGILDPADPGGIYARRSTTSLAGPWESLGAIALPEWTRAYGVNHLWAPHVIERGGIFHLYYSASSFGTNTSAIGLATTRTPGDLASWRDQGPILTSDEGDDFNAIDPQVFRGDRGRWQITFGSFWSGIKVQELTDMRTPVGPVRALASRPGVEFNPIENPQVFRHGRYWYLTTSWDFCCQGAESTYQVAVGRSRSASGPYLDRDGVPLTEGGGTVILSERGNQVGTGAMDVLHEFGRYYAVHHYYDDGGPARMQVREVEWEDGWPVFPLYDGDR